MGTGLLLLACSLASCLEYGGAFVAWPVSTNLAGNFATASTRPTSWKVAKKGLKLMTMMSSSPHMAPTTEPFEVSGESLKIDVNPQFDASKMGSLHFGLPGSMPVGGTCPSKATKPLLLYVPGLDGTQMFAEPQFEDLSRAFELRVLTIPSHDRLDFDGLVGAISEYLSCWNAVSKSKDKPILLGESCGGMISMGVALRHPNLLNSIVLVNPATSYKETVWPILGRFLAAIPDITPLGSERLPSLLERINIKDFASGLGLLPDRSLGDMAYAGAAAPLLALAAFDPYQIQKYATMAGTKALDLVSLVPSGKAPEEALDLAREAVDALQYLFEILPPATVKHRLNKVLMPGCDAIQDRLAEVQTPTLVLYGEGDNMLPSSKEAKRLRAGMKKCKIVQLGGAGHLVLDERVNTTKIIENTPSVAPLSWRKDPVTGWVMPSKAEIAEASEGIALTRRLSSPVFMSTDSEGQVEVGLRHLRTSVFSEDKPVLFVGNHQLLALDLGVMLDGVYQETGRLLRGLAHPMLFEGAGGVPGVRTGEGTKDKNMYETFGAVPVSARNAHKLLSKGEAVLLFPGGISEAMHGKDEYYTLKWPNKTDFVRLASRFNATIVPFCGVGASEAATVLMDADEAKEFSQSPVGSFLGSLIPGSSEMQSQNRPTFGTEGLNSERLTMSNIPIVVPKPPWDVNRFYFLFGAPISTDDINIDDADQCETLYKDVQDSVNECITYLLKNREDDPYKELSSRLLYETTRARSAPTFNPPPLKQKK